MEGKVDIAQIAFQFYIAVHCLTSRTPCYVWQLSLFSCGICRGYITVLANRTTHTMNCAIKVCLQHARPEPQPSYRVGLFAISSAAP